MFENDGDCRKQRQLLFVLNSEIEAELEELKRLDRNLKSEKAKQVKCEEMMKSHLKDIPRVKGLYDDLSESMDRYTHQARSARLGLQNITDEIRDVQTSLEENKPGLARYYLL